MCSYFSCCFYCSGPWLSSFSSTTFDLIIEAIFLLMYYSYPFWIPSPYFLSHYYITFSASSRMQNDSFLSFSETVFVAIILLSLL